MNRDVSCDSESSVWEDELARYEASANRWLAGAWSHKAGSYEHARCVSGYVLAKLMVDEDESCDLLSEMLDLSVKKTMGMSMDEFRALEAATTCKGAKTSSVKKALLLRSVERDFDMSFPRYSTAGIKTLERLCELVGALQGKGGGDEQFQETNYILK